jgi:hypothetical protein
MDGDRGAQTAALPSERVLRWVAGVVGGMRVVSVENPSRSTHRPSGTFRLRVDGTRTGATDLILKLSVSRWITDGMVITNARALQLAETHGLAAPRLIAADLDGRASGTVATLENLSVRQQRSPADGFCRPPRRSRSRNREGQRRRLGATCRPAAPAPAVCRR